MTLPVTLPVTAPVIGPANAVAVIVPASFKVAVEFCISLPVVPSYLARASSVEVAGV